MKNLILLITVLLLSGCAGMNKMTVEETNIAVSSLLDEIQIAINEIDQLTSESESLPPFSSAEVTLSTVASKMKDGSASLVLSGGGSKKTTSSNSITLELVANTITPNDFVESEGHLIAGYVIAAVRAVDSNKFLKLKTLNVESGLIVTKNDEGGIEIELAGISVKAKKYRELSTGHSLTLKFAHPNKKEK